MIWGCKEEEKQIFLQCLGAVSTVSVVKEKKNIEREEREKTSLNNQLASMLKTLNNFINHSHLIEYNKTLRQAQFLTSPSMTRTSALTSKPNPILN